MTSLPHVCPSNSVSAAGVSSKGTFYGSASVSSSTSSPWLLTRQMSFDQLDALKTLTSICSPGADGGAVKFWIYSGGGASSLSKRPSAGPSSWTTANLLSQWKVSLGMITEENKTDFYERPQCVTWDFCLTQRLSHCCFGSAFGKWALTTVDRRILLMSTEHCDPWPRRIRRRIGGVVRRMFRGGGVSHNEKLLCRNSWYNPT